MSDDGWEDWDNAKAVELATRERWANEAVERTRKTGAIWFCRSGDAMVVSVPDADGVEVIDALVRRVRFAPGEVARPRSALAQRHSALMEAVRKLRAAMEAPIIVEDGATLYVPECAAVDALLAAEPKEQP